MSLRVIDVLRYTLYCCSNDIHDIKMKALLLESKTVTSWDKDHYTTKVVVFCKEYINPKNPNWRRYTGLKREVRRLLEYLAWRKYHDTGGKAPGPDCYHTKCKKIQKDIDEHRISQVIIDWVNAREKAIKERQVNIQVNGTINIPNNTPCVADRWALLSKHIKEVK